MEKEPKDVFGEISDKLEQIIKSNKLIRIELIGIGILLILLLLRSCAPFGVEVSSPPITMEDWDTGYSNTNPFKDIDNYIIENKLQRQLQELTGKVWNEIEEEIKLKRPAKYGE